MCCINMCRSTTKAYVQRFLHHWRPDLAVLVESEIWPNLVLETKGEGIPASAHQRTHVIVFVQALAQAPWLEPSAVLGLRPRAGAERQPR
jgi:hypothetical protein